jgi:hypothetical protein
VRTVRRRSVAVLLMTAAFSSLAAVVGSQTSVERPDPPRVFLLDASRLHDIRERVRRDDAALAPAWAVLEADASQALSAGPFSVVDKTVTPPSGDKHDYMSQAPYFWPNPKAPNGLPYVRRDGERNPEIERISDHRSMDRMVGAVETLSLAWWLGGDAKHAQKAAQLLRVWFVDPATRMNPNLEYAQYVPGVNTGRGIGLIETRGLTRVVDAVGLLQSSPAWRSTDDRALREWFGRFLDWMLQSEHGRQEAAAKNNHGTYFDLQVASFALFVGRTDLARQTLAAARDKRIAAQIEPDGRQPLELARTRSWSYSVGNLDGLTLLATLGDRVGVDLWHYRTSEGRCVRAALLFLAPYATSARPWPYQQLGDWTPQALFPLLRRASAHYQDDEFSRLVAGLPPVPAADRSIFTR